MNGCLQCCRQPAAPEWFPRSVAVSLLLSRFSMQCLQHCVNSVVLSPVCRISVTAGDAHQIVRNYLLYHGYGDTLAAFDAAAGAEGIAQPMRCGSTTSLA